MAPAAFQGGATAARVPLSASAPVVALLPWGDLIEDFLTTLGVSLEQFRDEMSGGWLFGYVDALARAGVTSVIVCVSAEVRRAQRWVHRPTGAALHVLPASAGYRALRRTLADPHAWRAREAGGLASQPAHQAAPYLATPLRALARELREARCTAMLCQEYEYQRFDLSVALGRVIGVPVFATFQGGDRPRTLLERPLRRLSVRACRGLVIGSGPEALRVQERYGLADARIARIPNPLEVSDWTSDAHTRTRVRAELGLAEDGLLVAWHGRVELRRKGLDVLLEAWERVGGPGRRLLLVGTGRDADALRARLSGRPEVTWIEEYVLDRPRMAGYLAAADVYVFPSRHEGFPVAPVEAMACGLPLVAADAPGIREIIGDGEAAAGVVVPTGDPGALADALEALLEGAARREVLGRRARARAQRSFAPDVVGARLREFLMA